MQIFGFGELSAEVQKRVIDREREQCASTRIEQDSWGYRNCITEMESVLGIRIDDWECGYSSHFFRWHMELERFQELLDRKDGLVRYINEVEDAVSMKAGKMYWGKGLHKTRRSRVLFDYDCRLTGTWTDDAFNKAFEERWEAVRKGWTIDDFVENLLEQFFSFWEEDIEHAYDDNVVIDDIKSSGMEFTKEGQVWACVA